MPACTTAPIVRGCTENSCVFDGALEEILRRAEQQIACVLIQAIGPRASWVLN